MQVQVRYVATKVTRARKPSQRVHVRAIDVDLTAHRMHLLRDGLHRVLIHTVRGRVGDHNRCDVLAVLLKLRIQVSQVDRAILRSLHDDHPKVRQRRRRSVRTVRRRRDQADVTAMVTTGNVVAANRQQASQLARRSRVWLHRYLGVSGDFDKPGAELVDKLPPTSREAIRCVRVHVRECWPRDGL